MQICLGLQSQLGELQLQGSCPLLAPTGSMKQGTAPGPAPPWSPPLPAPLCPTALFPHGGTTLPAHGGDPQGGRQGAGGPATLANPPQTNPMFPWPALRVLAMPLARCSWNPETQPGVRLRLWWRLQIWEGVLPGHARAEVEQYLRRRCGVQGTHCHLCCSHSCSCHHYSSLRAAVSVEIAAATPDGLLLPSLPNYTNIRETYMKPCIKKEVIGNHKNRAQQSLAVFTGKIVCSLFPGKLTLY